MPDTYYAATDVATGALALFKVTEDGGLQTVDMSYLGRDGVWHDDPSVVDQLHEPGVRQVTLAEAETIESELRGGAE